MFVDNIEEEYGFLVNSDDFERNVNNVHRNLELFDFSNNLKVSSSLNYLEIWKTYFLVMGKTLLTQRIL